MKHNPTVTAHAAAATTALVFIICRTAFSIAPNFSMQVAKSWFHGIDITRIRALNFTSDSFVLGLITATLGAWVAGYVFAASYNYFSKK